MGFRHGASRTTSTSSGQAGDSGDANPALAEAHQRAASSSSKTDSAVVILTLGAANLQTSEPSKICPKHSTTHIQCFSDPHDGAHTTTTSTLTVPSHHAWIGSEVCRG